MASNQESESNSSRSKPSGGKNRGINAFNKLKKKCWNHFQPRNVDEERIVGELVTSLWRMRALQIEAEKSANKSRSDAETPPGSLPPL